ncbi:hypothetical protein LB524_18685 [Mesorhizobium sp. ESP6-5]|uniref:hypothetical protein n=1 Tax=Mesorhizobium sp. ESP6-5 TaxID=2876623 RepID=UPI001CCBCA72|nr:hypothetical protein [Mesorhizobium sp. ESP6-5]MBZ9757315.1 hypothetical protein [Mesorhizobium sp. ESP6-5]
MDTTDRQELNSTSMALLRLTDDEWRTISETRRHGERFSLRFSHQVAREGQRGGLVLVSTPQDAISISALKSTFRDGLYFLALFPLIETVEHFRTIGMQPTLFTVY